MELIWLIALFVGLLAIRCPVAYAMIITSFIALWTGNLPVLNVSLKIASGVDSFPLLAIPLFILAGNLMNTLGITERIFGLAGALVRHLPGGLGHADAGGLGAVEIKAMREAGYPPAFSAAITAASATIGPVVPPSIAMVLYAFLAEQSIAAMFLAGIVPGLLMAAAMMALVYSLSRSEAYTCPVMPRATLAEIASATRQAAVPMLAPLILVGGILLGVFTPTEAGVVVVMYALVVGVGYQRFRPTEVMTAVRETVRTSAATLFIIAASMIFGWIVVVHRAPDLTLAFVSTFIESPTAVMACIILTMLVIGMFLEGIPAQVLTVPTFLALATRFGIDPIHMGVVVVLTIMIGSLTPPVGLVLYTVMAISKVRMHSLVRALWPFYLVLLLTTLVVGFVPSLSLWLPGLLLGR